MKQKELLSRALAEIKWLREANQHMAEQLRIVDCFCQLINPRREGAMASDIAWELNQAIQGLEGEKE